MGKVENPIAEFRDCIYKNGFGFDVKVYQKATDIFFVDSTGLLNDTYPSFDDFLDDLVLQNPLWFTYYYVRIDKRFKQTVESKLKDTINKVFHWLDHSVLCTNENWQFNGEPLADFIRNEIKENVARHSAFTFSCKPNK